MPAPTINTNNANDLATHCRGKQSAYSYSYHNNYTGLNVTMASPSLGVRRCYFTITHGRVYIPAIYDKYIMFFVVPNMRTCYVVLFEAVPL